MFGRTNIRKIISRGDLAKLQKVLEKDPLSRFEWHTWERDNGARRTGTMLHIAAAFNQPEIIKLLVNQYGMNVNEPNKVSSRTPLHMACEDGSAAAALALLQLGADTTLVSRDGTPFELCRDMRIKRWIEESQQPKEQPVEEAPVEKKQESIPGEAPTDNWSIKSSSEIVHEHEYELQAGPQHITDIFNFSAGRLISIVKDLKSGSLSHSQYFFDESDVAGNRTLGEAFERLNSKEPALSQPTLKRLRI